MSNIINLFRKDVLIEWRQKAALASMLIYVVSTVFVIYFSFSGVLANRIWIGIYWIILLFVVVNLTIRTFSDESGPQFYYIRSLVKPADLILGKLLYNGIYFTVLSVITLGALVLFLGFEIVMYQKFLLVVFCGAFGLSNMFTLLSAITARINNVALIAILGFPIVIPLLLLSIKLSLRCLDPFMADGFYGDLAVLAILDVLIIGLAVILFNYLWRD